jgi:hypothetical protein
MTHHFGIQRLGRFADQLDGYALGEAGDGIAIGLVK